MHASLILGSGIIMPFADNSVDVLIQSSVIHEIYSYVANGREAWKNAISEAGRVLSENGVLLLRDFSAVSSDTIVDIELKSSISQRFYDYFRSHYRTFSGWEETEVRDIADKRNPNDRDYPQRDPKTNRISLAFSNAAELILHFRNFKDDYNGGLTDFDDPRWKEINETYLPPNPDKANIVTMPINDYVNEVMEVANITLTNTLYTFVCVQNKVSERPETVAALKDDFDLSLKDSGKTTGELLSGITEKMELIFKKVRKEAFL